MKRHGHLFERITAFDNLLAAAKRAGRGKRHKQRVAHFFFHLEKELLRLQEELLAGAYLPEPYHSFEIKDPKPRLISAADFRDRVLHHAICAVIEPLLDRRMIFDSWACRRNKGSHRAVKRAQSFSRNHGWFFKCDVQKFFASVDHAILKQLLARVFKDQQLLDLLALIIDTGGEQGRGLPIGNLTSQHFANLYLGELDHFLKDYLGCKGYLRYMDDMLLFGANRQELLTVFAQIESFLQERLYLELKPAATVLAPVFAGIPYLGFRIFPGIVRLDRRTLKRFRRRVRRLENVFLAGNLDTEQLAVSVQAMAAHIHHGNTRRLRQKLFAPSLQLG